MNTIKPYSIIVYGPTGVGKSDFGVQLAKKLGSAHIVNADMGQFYAPFSIGTAKPNWRYEEIPHHLFDIINEPINTSVTRYREIVLAKCNELWSQSIIPIIVGGSGFYLKSLFFPPSEESRQAIVHEFENDPSKAWQYLAEIDPLRASQINPHDTYRVLRALDIWYATGKKPSDCAPVFKPCMNTFIINVTRDRQELYRRIDGRVESMVQQGWIKEVEDLKDTPWRDFIVKKKLIGYDDILAHLETKNDSLSSQAPIAAIQQKTRHYAKRQETFWRMFERIMHQQSTQNHDYTIMCETVNLTFCDVDLYIEKLRLQLAQFFVKGI